MVDKARCCSQHEYYNGRYRWSPGETEEEWQTSFDFAREMQFQHMHIFSYSPREGTKAARLSGRVPGPIQKERNQSLHRLGQIMKRAAFDKVIGQTRDVLFEKAQKLDDNTVLFAGYTPNYYRVEVQVPKQVALDNQIVAVTLTGVSEQQDALVGNIADDILVSMSRAKLQTAATKSTLLHVVDQH